MPRNLISILCYIVAGFFVYMVTVLAFIKTGLVNDPGEPSPTLAFKCVMMAAYSLPGVLALVTGLRLRRFKAWRRDVGVVLVSGAVVSLLGVLTFTCMLLTPEAAEFFPANPNRWNFFSDLATGFGSILFSLGTGVALIVASRRSNMNAM
jgi:hypothetical protein